MTMMKTIWAMTVMIHRSKWSCELDYMKENQQLYYVRLCGRVYVLVDTFCTSLYMWVHVYVLSYYGWIICLFVCFLSYYGWIICLFAYLNHGWIIYVSNFMIDHFLCWIPRDGQYNRPNESEWAGRHAALFPLFPRDASYSWPSLLMNLNGRAPLRFLCFLEMPLIPGRLY